MPIEGPRWEWDEDYPRPEDLEREPLPSEALGAPSGNPVVVPIRDNRALQSQDSSLHLVVSSFEGVDP